MEKHTRSQHFPDSSSSSSDTRLGVAGTNSCLRGIGNAPLSSRACNAYWLAMWQQRGTRQTLPAGVVGLHNLLLQQWYREGHTTKIRVIYDNKGKLPGDVYTGLVRVYLVPWYLLRRESTREEPPFTGTFCCTAVVGREVR